MVGEERPPLSNNLVTRHSQTSRSTLCSNYVFEGDSYRPTETLHFRRRTTRIKRVFLKSVPDSVKNHLVTLDETRKIGS